MPSYRHTFWLDVDKANHAPISAGEKSFFKNLCLEKMCDFSLAGGEFWLWNAIFFDSYKCMFKVSGHHKYGNFPQLWWDIQVSQNVQQEWWSEISPNMFLQI